MVKKAIIAFSVLVLATLLFSVGVAEGSLGFNHTVTDGEFDFEGGSVLITNNYAEAVTVHAYKNDATETLVTPIDLNPTLSFTLSLSTFVENDVLKVQAVDSNDTVLESTEITIKPRAPEFTSFTISDDEPIRDDNVTISIDVTDVSGIDPDSVVAHISVPATCAALTDATVSMSKATGTDNTYQVIDYSLSYSCVYTIYFTADDVYANEGTSASSTVTVYELLADGFAALEGDNFDLDADNDLDFVLDYSGDATRFAVAKSYLFDLDAEKYGLHDISLIFTNSTDVKEIVSSELATDDYQAAVEGLDYVASTADAFEATITGEPSGKACFVDADGNVLSEKYTLLYCSDSSCGESDWSLYELDDETGCMESAIGLGSKFVLAKCADDYWYSDKCHTTLASTGSDGDSSSSSDPSTPTIKKTTTTDTTTSTTTGADGTNTTGEDGAADGGFLSGMGTFFAENRNTSISIGVGAVLVAGLVFFIVLRKRRMGGSGKEDKDRPSIHELAKKHDVHKPTDPKDIEKLKDFIEVSMMMGHDAHDLKDALKYRGWDPKAVDGVFKSTSFKSAKK